MRRALAKLVTLVAGASVDAQGSAFADAKLLCRLPWDTDWVTAVRFVGNDKVAAGKKIGDILLWDLPASPR